VAVTLQSITFCHNVADPARSALRIRRNYATPIQSPKWTNGGPGGFADAPAAYARGAVAAPSVQVGLTGGTPGSVLWVRATGGKLLGDPAAAQVSFDANGSAAAMLALVEHDLIEGSVTVTDETLTWQISPDNRTWSWLATTRHRVYLTLALPQAPWTQGAAQGGTPPVNEPWTDVLDWACAWAAGLDDVSEVAEQITQAVNGNGNAAGGVVYEPVRGATTYSAFGRFQCTAFLARLNGANPQSNFVNCADCASIVTTFANILGCRLWELRLSPVAGDGFDINPVIGIGGTAFGAPFQDRSYSFSFHEVAWEEGPQGQDGIYDACLQVNGNELERTRTPDTGHQVAFLSAGEPFTDGDGADTFLYREQLAVKTLIPGIVPRYSWLCESGTMTRRPVR